MTRPPAQTGGPAFPCEVGCIEDKLTQYKGMTLRDYFAAAALGHIPALLAAKDKNPSCEQIAKWAYQVADAMLEARNK